MERGLQHIPGFESETGISPQAFYTGLRRHIEQYRMLCSSSFNLSDDAGLMEYASQIKAGGLELPSLLVNMADFGLPFEQGVQGLPRNVEISEARKKLWSKKLREVFFPIADMIGWHWAANSMRRNAVLWDPDLKDKLEEKEVWLNENMPTLSTATSRLNALVSGELQAITGLSEFSSSKYVLHEPRIKSPAAIVLKEEEGRSVMDLVATRVVFFCEPALAQQIGIELLKRLKKSGNFSVEEAQDYYKKPKKSGYTAVHITGWLFNRLGVPCEVQVMDIGSYLNAVCGRASRLVYKSGAKLQDTELYEAINKLLEPVLQAVMDVSHAVKAYIPISAEVEGEFMSYVAHLGGDSRRFRMRKGITVVDAVVHVSNLLKVQLRNAVVHEGNGTLGRKLSFFDDCPPEITICPGEALSRGTMQQILNHARVLEETKLTIRDNGS